MSKGKLGHDFKSPMKLRTVLLNAAKVAWPQRPLTGIT